MSTSVPTDAEWAAINPKFRLAMSSLRRQCEDLTVERDGIMCARQRLERDYDTVCADLQQAHAQVSHAQAETAAANVERSMLEKQVVSVRGEVTSLGQQLLVARQEGQDMRALMEKQRDAFQTEVQGRERDLIVQLERADKAAREATETLAQERKLTRENTQCLELERDDARAGWDQALLERIELQGIVADKDRDLAAARQALQEKQGVSWAVHDQPAAVHPTSLVVNDHIAARVMKDTACPLPLPVEESATKSTVALTLDDPIDLTLDSDGEQPVSHAHIAPKQLISSAPADMKTKSPPAKSLSTARNATPGPGPSAVRHRENSAKRSAGELELEPARLAKRPRMTSQEGAVNSSNNAQCSTADLKIPDNTPSSLNQRLANIRSLQPKRIPAHKLPSTADPTVGWVKRALFVREYKAAAKASNTYLTIPPSMFYDKDSLPGAAPERTDRQPVLFLELDDYNPGLPTRFGQPGTIIMEYDFETFPIRLDVLVVVSKESVCKFVGKYHLTRETVGVTQQEWKSMPKTTRAWANVLAAGRRKEYMTVMMDLVVSFERKQAVTNSRADDSYIERRLEEYKKLDTKAKKEMRPTPEQVRLGLEMGYATIDVIAMTPVSGVEKLYEEIWDKHLAGDCYVTAEKGKKVDVTVKPNTSAPKSKAASTPEAASKFIGGVPVSDARCLLESVADKYSQSQPSASNGTLMSDPRHSARAPKQLRPNVADRGSLASSDDD